MDGDAPSGLYLKPPHGELSFTGAKRALAKAREFGIEGQPFVLCSGPSAWGELVLGGPEAVGVDEFDARFSEHRVSVKERAKWWPEEERLYIYPYAEWRPYGRPRRVTTVPASVQTLMGPVEFLGDKEADMGQGVTININTGEDTKLLRAMAGDGEAIADLGGKGSGAATEGKDEEEALKVWTAADATEHTEAADTPEKKNQWAGTANGARKTCLDKIEGTPTDAQVDACEASAIRIANAAVKGKKEAVMDHRSKQAQDELSFSDIQSLMWDALSPSTRDSEPYAQDVDIYDDYVTYKLEGIYYIRSCAIVDSKLQLGEAVEAEVIIRPKGGQEEPADKAKTDHKQANEVQIAKDQGELAKHTQGDGKALSLATLREQADKALEAVVGFWKAVTGDGSEAALALEGKTGLKTFEAADGQTWILTWTTNAFLDRDEEIFSTKSIEEYAERAWKEIEETGSKGQYDFWHAQGSEFADIKWVGAIGRFLVEMGTFRDDEVGRVFKKFFTECPEAQKDIAPKGWKASHRFKFRPWDKADGVYEWFDKDRTSVLAAHRAANPYTAMEVLDKMLNDEQKEMLKKVGESTGVDLLGIVQETEDETKRLEDANVAHKAKGGEEGDDDTTKEKDPPMKGEQEQVEAIAKHVAGMMGLEELGKMLQGLLDSNEAIKGELTKVVGRLDEVEKGDLERMEDKKDWRPHVPWFRASKAGSTILDDTEDNDKDLKGKQPEVPEAIKGLTDWRIGQPPAAGGSA